mgnify:CR=1 FL=1
MSVFLTAFLGAVAGAAALIGATVLYVYLKYRQVIRKAEEEQGELRVQLDAMIRSQVASQVHGAEFHKHFVPIPSSPGVADLPRGACDGPPNTRMAS